jgi:predicted membrane protein
MSLLIIFFVSLWCLYSASIISFISSCAFSNSPFLLSWNFLSVSCTFEFYIFNNRELENDLVEGEKKRTRKKRFQQYETKVKKKKEKRRIAGQQWLTTIILATKESEFRRITVQGQPGQIVQVTLSRKYPTEKKGWWSGSSGRVLGHQK